MKRVPVGHILIGAFVGAAIWAIVTGFLIIGSPMKQRQMRLDDKRLSHLRQIAFAIDSHWKKQGALPSALADLPNRRAATLVDPETGEPFTYRVIGKRSYQLCAVFALKGASTDGFPWPFEFATHEAGFHCFERKL